MQPNFDYFQTHDFHKLIQKKQAKNSFSILHTNICSLYANGEDLEMLITNLEHNFSVIALSETWTSKQVTNKQLPEPRNYQPFCATQGTTTKSDCGFYVKRGLKFKSRKDLDLAYHGNDSEFQSCWIEILNKKEPNTIIGVYYRHPKKNSNDIFNIKLDGTIKKIKDNNKTKIICGDFNYNFLNHEYNNRIKNFIDIMYSHFFQPYITEPTRIVGRNKPSLVDNIFINACTKSLNAGNITDKIYDHLPNFLIIQNLKEERLKRKMQIRDMKNFKLETFSTDLKKAEQWTSPRLLILMKCITSSIKNY